MNLLHKIKVLMIDFSIQGDCKICTCFHNGCRVRTQKCPQKIGDKTKYKGQ